MNVSLMKFVSRVMVTCMMALPLQAAQAAMVGTEQVVAAAQAQLDRNKVRSFMARADVQQQLQAMGVKAGNAQERVSAMTDEEVRTIAGKIDSLPAGAASGWAIAAIVVVIGLIVWWVWS
ncbi:MAG: PA2779 family protein [Thiobacillaceae bacterium]